MVLEEDGDVVSSKEEEEMSPSATDVEVEEMDTGRMYSSVVVPHSPSIYPPLVHGLLPPPNCSGEYLMLPLVIPNPNAQQQMVPMINPYQFMIHPGFFMQQQQDRHALANIFESQEHQQHPYYKSEVEEHESDDVDVEEDNFWKGRERSPPFVRGGGSGGRQQQKIVEVSILPHFILS